MHLRPLLQACRDDEGGGSSDPKPEKPHPVFFLGLNDHNPGYIITGKIDNRGLNFG